MVNTDYGFISKASTIPESMLNGYGQTEDNKIFDSSRNKSLPLGYAFPWLWMTKTAEAAAEPLKPVTPAEESPEDSPE